MRALAIATVLASLAAAGPASAQTLAELQTQLDTLLNRTAVISTRTQTLVTRTGEIRAETQATLAEAQYMAQLSRDGMTAISPQVSNEIRDGLQDIEVILALQREGLAAFLGVTEVDPVFDGTSFDFSPRTERADECLAGSPCFQFRADLDALLQQLGELHAALLTRSPVPEFDPDADFDEIRRLMEGVPHRALFPLYRVLVIETDVFARGLPALLTSTTDAVNTVNAVERPDGTPSEPAAADRLPQRLFESNRCDLVTERFDQIQVARSVLSYSSYAVTIIGHILKAWGYTYFKVPDLSGGYAGIADVEVQLSANKPATAGTIFVGVGAALASTSTFMGTRVESCASLTAQLDILANQQRILDALALLPREGDDGDDVGVGNNDNDGGRSTPGAGCSAAPAAPLGALLAAAALLRGRMRGRRSRAPSCG